MSRKKLYYRNIPPVFRERSGVGEEQSIISIKLESLALYCCYCPNPRFYAY